MHEYDSDEDEEAVAFRERLHKLAEESPANEYRNTRSMDLRIYGVDMSQSAATQSPMLQAAAAINILNDDEELAKATARATKLLAQAKAANERAVLPKPSMVPSREAAVRKSTLPPPGLARPARNSLAPPPGLVIESKWNEYYDDKQKAPYWHCPSTGETTWIKPVDEQKACAVVPEKRTSIVGERRTSAVSETVEKHTSIVGERRTSTVPETVEKRTSIVGERRTSAIPETVEKRTSIVGERRTSAVPEAVEKRTSIVVERRTSAVPESKRVSVATSVVADRKNSIASVTTTAALAASRRTSLATIDTDRRSSLTSVATTITTAEDEDEPLQVTIDEPIINKKQPQNLAIILVAFVSLVFFIYLYIVRL